MLFAQTSFPMDIPSAYASIVPCTQGAFVTIVMDLYAQNAMTNLTKTATTCATDAYMVDAANQPRPCQGKL